MSKASELKNLFEVNELQQFDDLAKSADFEVIGGSGVRTYKHTDGHKIYVKWAPGKRAYHWEYKEDVTGDGSVLDTMASGYGIDSLRNFIEENFLIHWRTFPDKE